MSTITDMVEPFSGIADILIGLLVMTIDILRKDN